MIYQNQNNIWNNTSTSTKRFLPIPESVSKHLEPEPKLSDFTVIQELGSGSFGHVILAQHKITQVKYAIKAIDKRNTVNIKEMPYFIREIEIMYRVHHPNVVKLFGHFEDNNYCYFIMEYIPGGNIYSLVQRLKPVSLQGIASIMKEVISSVYFLHHMNPKIVHRDIKPENVLLDQGNHAKLTDFGWSNYMEGDIKRTTVCGTPVYLAPEIINNMGHDEHVDIWCIGVLLFELIVGRPPFSGETEQKVRYNILKMKINWPNNIDSDAASVNGDVSNESSDMPSERVNENNSESEPGDAIFTSAGTFSANAKLNREQLRAQNKETLLNMINSGNLSEAQKAEITDQMIHITEVAELENEVETLLEAKGFNGAVVSIGDENVDVVVNMTAVSDTERAKIEDVVKRKTNVSAANIVITPISDEN